jgi:hypothetical protein
LEPLPRRSIDTIDRDREGKAASVIGHWQSREGVPGDADEIGWLMLAEIIEQNRSTARALLPLIDLVVRI